VVRTRRRLDIVAVLVALLLAAQPLLHNHPLDGGRDAATQTAPSTCAVCATGIGRLPSTAPALSAPHSILYTLVAAPVAAIVSITPLTRDSRGPPVA
jgi:hypothetical protein